VGLLMGQFSPEHSPHFVLFLLFFSLSLLNSAIHTCKIVLQWKNI
jgi:hypothetical protein